jgi:hypothetical protein
VAPRARAGRRAKGGALARGETAAREAIAAIEANEGSGVEIAGVVTVAVPRALRRLNSIN